MGSVAFNHPLDGYRRSKKLRLEKRSSPEIRIRAKLRPKSFIVVDGKPYGPIDGDIVKGGKLILDVPSVMHMLVVRGATIYRIQLTLNE